MNGNPSESNLEPRIQRLLETFSVDPNDTPAFETLEEYLFLNGRWSHLAGVYECRISVVTAGSSELFDLVLRLARLLDERLGDRVAARRRYEELLAVQADHPEALASLRRLYTRAGELTAALQITEMEESLELPKSHKARTLAEIGQLWGQMGDTDEARARYDRAIALDPGCDIALSGKAALAEVTGEIGNAILLHERRLDGLTGANRIDAMEHLAMLLPNDQSTRIRTLLREVVNANPRRRRALERLIEIEKSEGVWNRVDELQRLLWAALREPDERARLAKNSAVSALDEAKDLDAALFWAERAAELAPSDPAVHRLAAKIFRVAGQPAALIRALEELIQLEGASPELTSEISELYEKLERTEDCVTWSRRHLECQPHDGIVLARLDRALSRLSQHEERIEVLEQRIRCAESRESAAKLRTEMGDLFAEKLDDNEASARAYDQALELVPDFEPAAQRTIDLLRKAEKFDTLALFLESFAERTASAKVEANMWSTLGDLRLREFGDADGARAAQICALNSDPGHAGSLEGLRRVAHQSGDLGSLLEACERELALDPDPERTLELLQETIAAARDAGDLPRALRAAARWAELDPCTLSLHSLADVSRESSDSQNEQLALEALDSLLQVSPNERAHVLARLGDLALEQADPDAMRSAAHWYRESLRLASSAEVRGRLLDLYRRTAQLPDLAFELRAALRDATPERESVLRLELARVVAELSDYAGAIDALLPAFNQDPTAGQVADLLETLLSDQQRTEELTQVLARRLAAERDPTLRREIAHRHAALLLDGLQRPTEAIAALQEVADASRDTALEALFERALEMGGTPQDHEAWLLRRESHVEGAERVRLLLRLSVLQERDERPEDAIAALRRASRLIESGADDLVRQPLLALLRKYGEPQAQLDLLEEIVAGESDPAARASLRIERARILAETLDRPQDAIEELERAQQETSLRSDEWRLLGDLYQRCGATAKHARALAELVDCSDNADEQIRVLHQLASLRLHGPDEVRDSAAAERSLVELLRRVPDDGDAFEDLYTFYADKGRRAEQADLLQGRLDLDGLSGEIRAQTALRLAEIQQELGEIDNAITTLREARIRGADSHSLDELLYGCLASAANIEGLLTLCEEKTRDDGRADRGRWLRRWLNVLEQAGEPAETRLNVVEQLLEHRPDDIELIALRITLLRDTERIERLSHALEEVLNQSSLLSDGRRRVYTNELLRLYEGPLEDPASALRIIERELPNNPHWRIHGAELAAALEDPAREAAILAPLVFEATDDTPATPEAVRRLALAFHSCGEADRANPLLWQAFENNPNDREVLTALEAKLRHVNDADGLLRLIELHFPLEIEDRRTNLAREAFELAERVHDSELALRWLQRWHALEQLPGKLQVRWLGFEQEVGTPSGTRQALRALQQSTDAPDERAEYFALEANVCAKQGQLDIARQRYATALSTATAERVDWLQALDEVLKLEGRSAERCEILRRISEHATLDAEARAIYREERIGLLAADLGRREEAAQEMRRLLHDDPNTERVTRIARMRKLLSLYLDLAQPVEWCDVAEELLPLLAGEEREELEREVARRLTDPLRARDRAVSRWELILNQSSDDPEALEALSSLLRVPGQEARLARILEKRAETGAGAAEILFLDAAELHWNVFRDAEAAFSCLDRALALEPQLGPAHRLRAEVCGQLHRPDEEAISLRALLAAEPENDDAANRWLRLGQICVTQPGGQHEAEEAAQKCLEHAEGQRDIRVEARELLESLAAWPQVARLLREEIADSNTDIAARLLRRLARIEWDELHDAHAAAGALETLNEMDCLVAEDLERWSDALAAQGRWPQAIEQRKRALHLHGEMAGPRGWLELARLTWERLEDAERARGACDEALSLNPQSVEALRLRADLNAELGDVAQEVDDRIKLGERLVDASDGAAMFSHAAELTRNGLGDDARAWSLFRMALKRDASRIPALLGAGEIALARGEWSEAERMFGLACALLPTSDQADRLADVARWAAEAAQALDRNAEAFRYLELSLGQDADHPQSLDAMAELSLKLGAFPQARECLERRLQQDGLDDEHRANHLVKLAKSCEGTRDRASAAAALEQVVVLNPIDEVSRARAVELLEGLGETARAVAQLDAWTERAPVDIRASLQLRAAKLESDSGQREAAHDRLEELVGTEPDLAAAWVALSNLVMDDHGATATLRVTERALAALTMEHERAPLLWLEARSYRALDRILEATQRACDTLRADAGNVEAAQLLAQDLGRTSDFQAAVTHLERTLDVAHPNPAIEAELWEAIGRAYAGPLENIERAERSYRRALECNPLRSSSREALADITAFDPAMHRESIRLHRDLLEEYPARPGSWRAITRISEHWKRKESLETCELVLRTLGQVPAADAELETRAPLVDIHPSSNPNVRAATELMAALDEANAQPLPGGAPTFIALPAALQSSVESIVGPAWSLSDEELRALWQQPVETVASVLETLPWKIKRRLRKAFSAVENGALGELETEPWREEVLAQAAGIAVQSGKLELSDALTQLLGLWPATQRLDLKSGGNLGTALQLCPPARILLLRIADATLKGLGL